MIDVGFYLRIAELKRLIRLDALPPQDATQREEIFTWLETNRSRTPVVFNLESTNACNRECPFCPRTTLMTRRVKTMSADVFRDVANQLTPHPPELWTEWAQHAEATYKIPQDEQSENAFFLYILPRVVILHGYGDPLLDPHIPEHIGYLHQRDIPTYFSCNPGNINLGKTANAFENGLTYIKYSIDSLSAPERGRDAFLHDYPLIMQVLDMKAKKNYKTKVIITMIDLNRPQQAEEYAALVAAFKGTDVYIYQKSLDQAWMVGGKPPKSLHWSEPCAFPWSSMSVNSSGLVIPCGQDYNSEMVIGDATTESLYDIWNGAAYVGLRRKHMDVTPGIRCTENCDMRVIGRFLGES